MRNLLRIEWDAYDVITQNELKVEVKAASYIQTWNQRKHSKIRFNIRSAKAWNAGNGKYSKEAKRQADVYVFCLLNHKYQKTLDPLNISQWTFFVISTESLNKQVGNQKSIGLSTLKTIGAKEVKFNNLTKTIHAAVTNKL